MKISTTRRLEDFGAQRTTSPLERKREYARQCKELPKSQRARFWLKILDKDVEVAAISTFKVTSGGRRK